MFKNLVHKNTCIKTMVDNTKYKKVEIIILVSRRLRKYGVMESHELSFGTSLATVGAENNCVELMDRPTNTT